MNFKRINNITGWIVCLIACSVYIMTMEASGSFWDCGEFVSSCFKLQIPHPPGAPLFVLMGRLFTLPFENPSTGVNLMSALASGFTILFLFWTITHFARKLVAGSADVINGTQMFSIMAAGVVGGLAYTFSDSFWYSAVEGEVYALSSFFTAVVFWAMCKWEHEVTREQRDGIKGRFTRADRWLVLIFYLMGLSIGVHLLNLLTLPAIVMVYYFKRYNVTKWGTFWAFVIGCLITGFIQKVVIVWTISNAGTFDIIFKNDFGLPFFSGFSFYFITLGAILIIGMRFKEDKVTRTHLVLWTFALLGFLILPELFKSNETGLFGRLFIKLLIIGLGLLGAYLIKINTIRYLKLSLWCLAFMLMGYSTYLTTLIRSNANPSIDMFNVDNPVNLVGYLSREQYGDWPILYGQDFTAEAEEQVPLDTYVKGKDKYEKNGRKYEFKYAAADKHFFPRMWDASNDQRHADYYANFAEIEKDPKTGKYLSSPTSSDNINFYIQYQNYWMYLRYFMWNFAGKQNDIQGIDIGNRRDGNWKSGVGFIDKIMLGDQKMLPDSIKHNKANNSLFFLPFILGILGIIYMYQKNKRDLLITGLLFFFTGFAIVVYLNQAGMQPRERDYAYVGSFYAFAIWIGLGVLFVKDLFNKFMKNERLSNYAAAGLCLLAVPVLMASQEWDDHDRSRKVLARDLAIDYLESCAPNAIVISFGDNDTYPLWYAQESEGIRQDVRVINSSLLGTDWYINQLRYKVNKSDPIDVIWTADQIQGSKRDGIYYYPQLPGLSIDPNQPMDLYSMMKDYAGSDDQGKMVQINETEFANIYPTKKVKIGVDQALVRQNGTVNAGDSVLNEIVFDLPRNVLGKNETAILNIIAANNWKRPIYFTSPYDELGFAQYLRSDGLTYRLVPVKNGELNGNWVVDKLMNKFVFGSADKKGVYFDEENRRHLNTIRMSYAMAGISLADNNRKEDAKKLLARADKMMLQENFPYGMVSRGQNHNQIAGQFLLAAWKAGDSVLARKVSASIRKDLNQQVAYFNSLSENQQMAISNDNDAAKALIQQIEQMEMYFKNPQTPVLNPETGPAINNNPPPRPDTQR